MLEIKINDTVYQVEIRVNKYGAILEIKKDNNIFYQDIFDLYSLNGGLSNHLTNAIQQQEQALKG